MFGVFGVFNIFTLQRHLCMRPLEILFVSLLLMFLPLTQADTPATSAFQYQTIFTLKTPSVATSQKSLAEQVATWVGSLDVDVTVGLNNVTWSKK